MNLTIKTDDGKWVCSVWGTHFRVQEATPPKTTGDRMLDDLNRGRYENGILYAYRNDDGTFETDVDCGARRLGFTQKQVTQILAATKVALTPAIV
jgi:hypothetical protein